MFSTINIQRNINNLPSNYYNNKNPYFYLTFDSLSLPTRAANHSIPLYYLSPSSFAIYNDPSRNYVLQCGVNGIVDSHIRVGNSSSTSSGAAAISTSIPTYNNYTITMWLNVPSTTLNKNSIVYSLNNSNSTYSTMLYFDLANNRIVLWSGGTSNTYISTTTMNFKYNTWMHYVVSVTRTAMNFYVNNILMASVLMMPPSVKTTVTITFLGQDYPPTPANFIGYCDDLYFYNYGLSASDISNNYFAQLK